MLLCFHDIPPGILRYCSHASHRPSLFLLHFANSHNIRLFNCIVFRYFQGLTFKNWFDKGSSRTPGNGAVLMGHINRAFTSLTIGDVFQPSSSELLPMFPGCMKPSDLHCCISVGQQSCTYLHIPDYDTRERNHLKHCRVTIMIPMVKKYLNDL